MEDVWKEVVQPRLAQSDWNGAAYGNPSRAVLEAATVWEYAREMPQICELIKECRRSLESNSKDATKLRKRLEEWLLPLNWRSLLENKGFPLKSFNSTKAYWNPFPMYYPGSVKKTRLFKTDFSAFGSSSKWGFSRRILSPACPNSFEIDGDDNWPDPLERIHWLVIAFRKSYQLPPETIGIDDYVMLVDEDKKKYRDTALVADNENLVISAAYADMDTGSIYMGDAEINLRGDYAVWTQSWSTARRAASLGKLEKRFRKALSPHVPRAEWTDKELRNALRALFAYRLLRADPKTDLNNLKLGTKEAAKEFPLSAVRARRQDVHRFADGVLPFAQRLFPAFQRIELISGTVGQTLKNNGLALFD